MWRMIELTSPIWSHSCAWIDLATLAAVEDGSRDRLLSGAGSAGQRSATARVAGSEVVVPARDLAAVPPAGLEPYTQQLAAQLDATSARHLPQARR
jgi:hypothetical protein